MNKEALRTERQKLDLSMAEAARRCRVPYRTWQDWELGNSKIPSLAETMIDFLKMTV